MGALSGHPNSTKILQVGVTESDRLQTSAVLPGVSSPNGCAGPAPFGGRIPCASV
jgi:hypothetical protein